MKLFTALTSLSTIYLSVICTPDYYWRPFDGIIPTDALVAGTLEDGERTFIGNMPVFGGGLYIGQLYAGLQKMNVTGVAFEGGPVHSRDDLIQILCTRNQELFEWVTVDPETVKNVLYHKVLGGYEYSILGNIHIGRVIYNNQLKIGKVCDYKESHGRIYFPDGRQEVSFYGTYEVLIYKGL